MFQMFQIYVAKADLDVACVAMAIHVSYKCMFQIYVVSVLSRCCICCTGYT
jgi:hypothetical protein